MLLGKPDFNDFILDQTRRLADKVVNNFETPRRLTFIPFALQMVIGHYGGDKEIRTLDPLRARQVLSQLSYIPIFTVYII